MEHGSNSYWFCTVFPMVIPQQQVAAVLLGLGWLSILKSLWGRGCLRESRVLRQQLCCFCNRQRAGMEIRILCKQKDLERLWTYWHLIWQCLSAFFCCIDSGLMLPSDTMNTVSLPCCWTNTVSDIRPFSRDTLCRFVYKLMLCDLN